MSDHVKTISCGEVLDIAGAAEFHQVLKSSRDENADLLIEAGAVSRVDGAGLQLLCALFHDAQRSGRSLQWGQTSPALHEAARVLGLEACLQLLKV
jgi:anti-anti-sigma regulatory factor